MTDHFTHAASKKLSTPCTAHDVNFGGGCFNCGWEPEKPRVKSKPFYSTLALATLAEQFLYAAGVPEGYNVFQPHDHHYRITAFPKKTSKLAYRYIQGEGKTYRAALLYFLRDLVRQHDYHQPKPKPHEPLIVMIDGVPFKPFSVNGRRQ